MDQCVVELSGQCQLALKLALSEAARTRRVSTLFHVTLAICAVLVLSHKVASSWWFLGFVFLTFMVLFCCCRHLFHCYTGIPIAPHRGHGSARARCQSQPTQSQQRRPHAMLLTQISDRDCARAGCACPCSKHGHVWFSCEFASLPRGVDLLIGIIYSLQLQLGVGGWVPIWMVFERQLAERRFDFVFWSIQRDSKHCVRIRAVGP